MSYYAAMDDKPPEALLQADLGRGQSGRQKVGQREHIPKKALLDADPTAPKTDPNPYRNRPPKSPGPRPLEVFLSRGREQMEIY